MGKIKKVLKDRQRATVFPNNDDSSFKPPQEFVARIYILEDVLEKCSASSLDKDYFDLNSSHSCMYMSTSLRITLELETGCRAIVQTIKEEDARSRPSSMNIAISDRSEITPEVLENYLKLHSKHEPLLLNSDATILLDNGERCVVQMLPTDCHYATIDGKDVEDLVVIVSPTKWANSSNEEILKNRLEDNSKAAKISMRYIEDILKDCEIALDLSLGLRRLAVDFRYDRENVLICGDVGSGKTTICKMLIERYREPPCFVHAHVIDCRSLKGNIAIIISAQLVQLTAMYRGEF
ncbi:uncharacterized protein LOC112553093 [Pogonomyrmex barbatus]|uniref:Uncharacterized protein LOC112553093 n=1 Tax=Pogonomyrmex barbatus TaxID=144034 RepID=A0A8N1SC95_9HYME|nr:uncharacterized protein LOC112553093 [Pogonomyrmex barbatus]